MAKRSQRAARTSAGRARRDVNTVQDAVLFVAEQLGKPGAGEEELIDYLASAARREPKFFAALLNHVLAYQITMGYEEEPEPEYATVDEVLEASRSGAYISKPKKALTISDKVADAVICAAAKADRDGNGQNGLSGYLFRIALEQPRSFVKFLRAILKYEANGQEGHHRDTSARRF